ncbi:uncharacterized protein LOC110669923 [Hevea brasiliensis]|uniref:uncharacterized protein LOC110669923 n=1 Tax=Hevea brasiliensis TaxID=3981 RepID=UPI0025DBF8F5|nr:uncharacterized protein LOC110669923 [Hevea brasiliensis]
MEWSPQYAMEAYLHTLQLSKRYSNEGSTKLIEPKYMEFVSALATGKQARLMMEITTQGITPLTLSLAVAAKQTGGKLICILPRDQHDFKKCRNHLQDLENVIVSIITVISMIIGDLCSIITAINMIIEDLCSIIITIIILV